jgi:hypothetical protein
MVIHIWIIGAERDPNYPVQLAPAATVFFETFERNYPNYPEAKDVKQSINRNELVNLTISFLPSPSFSFRALFFKKYIWIF